MEPPVRDQAERSPESSSASQAMFHVGSSNSPQVQKGPQLPQLLLGTEASAPFGIHHSQSCVEPQIWLTLSWNFQGLIYNPQLVPRNQGHRNACPTHPPTSCSPCTHQGSQTGKRGRDRQDPQTTAPHLDPSPGYLGRSKKKKSRNNGPVPSSDPMHPFLPQLPRISAYFH